MSRICKISIFKLLIYKGNNVDNPIWLYESTYLIILKKFEQLKRCGRSNGQGFGIGI